MTSNSEIKFEKKKNDLYGFIENIYVVTAYQNIDVKRSMADELRKIGLTEAAIKRLLNITVRE